MHVDGKSAHLIVANPNGISCNGCSISGAEQLTLSGGKVELSQEGQLLYYHNPAHTSNIRLNNIHEDAFSSVNKFNVIAENITIGNSKINTPGLNLFNGHELVKYLPNSVRGLEILPGDDGAVKSKLTIQNDSYIKTDNLYINANNATVRNHGNIKVGPVGDAQKQKYMNSQLTMVLINSMLTNGSKGIIRTTKTDSVLQNSQLINNGNISIDGSHNMIAIGNAVINNRGNMSFENTTINGLKNITSGVGINNKGNMTGSWSVKADIIALNNKNYLEALNISTDSDILYYANNGEIMNETANLRAYELYHSDNGKISSNPQFEYEIKKPL